MAKPVKSPGQRKSSRDPGRKPRRGPAPLSPVPPVLGRERMLKTYHFLKLNRLLEDRLSALCRQGKIQGGLHSSRGQEAISVGSAMALEPGDILASMLRNLGAMLVRGVRPLDLFLQYLQRQESPCRGRDTSLHFGRMDQGFVAPISHLGALVPVLSGVALAARMQRRPLVALTYVGDGASSTGDFHEGLGFAAAKRLPLVVVLENNRWAYSTPVSSQSRLTDFSEKGRAHGMARGVADGNDVLAVYEAVSRAAAIARRGEGPVLLECKTMRMKGHSEHDDAWYVPRTELEFWQRRDPILLFERRLRMEGLATEGDLRKIEERCRAEIEADLEKALAAPFPEPGSCLEDVYAPPRDESHPLPRHGYGGEVLKRRRRS